MAPPTSQRSNRIDRGRQAVVDDALDHAVDVERGWVGSTHTAGLVSVADADRRCVSSPHVRVGTLLGTRPISVETDGESSCLRRARNTRRDRPSTA